MAQINLLKQSGGTGNFSNLLPKIIVRLFALVLAALIGYYVWLFIDLNNVNKQIAQAQDKTNNDRQVVSSITNRSELYTRQLQLKNLQGLISKHVYWSQLLPEIARVTLKSASYKNLNVSDKGDLLLNVSVPTLIDLAKYMEIFDIADYNKNFDNIRVGGFSQVQDKGVTSIQFQVSMKFNPQIIQYQEPKK